MIITLLFLLPADSTSVPCSIIASTALRMEIDTSDCVLVAHCFFIDLKPDPAVDGAAIHFAKNSGEAQVHETTFLRCQTSTAGFWGGDCYFAVPTVTLVRYCGNDCHAYLGHFADFEHVVSAPHRHVDLTDSSQLLCGASYPALPSAALNAGLYFEREIEGNVTNSNFTLGFRQFSLPMGPPPSIFRG
jgi:hypothetical protein